MKIALCQMIMPACYEAAIRRMQQDCKHCFVFNHRHFLPLHPMMKWLVLLLVFMITAGTFIPCCGAADCCADQPAGTGSANEHKTEGTCSPFFACGACSGFVQLYKPVHVASLFVEKQVHYSTIPTFNLSTYSPSFWQPPRTCRVLIDALFV